MITTLALQNFTVFEQADLSFSPGLNVIVGENGAGKTHLLKLSYSLSNGWYQLKDAPNFSKERVGHYFSSRLRHVFKVDKIGHLTRSESDGKTQVSVFNSPMSSLKNPNVIDQVDWSFNFSNRAQENINMGSFGVQLKANQSCGKSVYFPAKEVLSLFEGLLALYAKREISLDETFHDLALHLSTPKLKTPPLLIEQALAVLIDDIGGTLELDGGKFYLITKGKKRQEITLAAEGIRKLATLIHLIENGSLEQGDTLFWDEPESNLNPKLIKNIAAALLFLANSGVQVVIATHSLFLLRELEILSALPAYQSVPQRYFALEKCATNVKVYQGDCIDDIEPLVMLDEDLHQSERFMAIAEAL